MFNGTVLRQILFAVRDTAIKLAIQRSLVTHKLLSSKRVITLTSHLLILSGMMFLTFGIDTLLYGQYDPEKAEARDNYQEGFSGPRDESPLQAGENDYLQDGNPEGVCCVDAYPQQLFTYNAQGANDQDAQQLNTSDAQGLNDSDRFLANAPPTDPEAITPLDPEPLDPNYDDSLNRFATGNLLRFIEGAFGALVMIGAGIGAIIAGAFGAYKAAISLLFVAVGAFILRALVSLFFGTNYPAYGGVEFVGGNGL